ncbi:uncharacterized protein [Palaemon carinicauda]|uniref:uncharacterized protein n=1 Tax=Palaemon carinicauda TaxID=392227 RepID=UPI0035B607B7
MDVEDWVHTCTSCLNSKAHQHTYFGVGTFHEPQWCFAHIRVDVVGRLPTLHGHCYLFTIINRSTRWPDAISMETATSASCISASLLCWMERFCIPRHINSDRSTTYTSQSWTSIVSLLDITLQQITAYNPAANGTVECCHSTFNAALMSRCKDSNWFTQLSGVLLVLRITPREALSVSAAEIVYGDLLVVLSKFSSICNILQQSPEPASRCKIYSMPPE